MQYVHHVLRSALAGAHQHCPGCGLEGLNNVGVRQVHAQHRLNGSCDRVGWGRCNARGKGVITTMAALLPVVLAVRSSQGLDDLQYRSSLVDRPC